MRRRHPWLSTASRVLVLSILLLTPAIASARTEEDVPDIIDGRLEGYATQTAMPETSTGMTWALFVILGVFTAGGLFKDAKRTHLD